MYTRTKNQELSRNAVEIRKLVETENEVVSIKSQKISSNLEFAPPQVSLREGLPACRQTGDLGLSESIFR